MCDEKYKSLARPRANILPSGETPRRILQLDAINRKRAQTAKFDIYSLQKTAKHRATIIATRASRLEKNEIQNYEQFQKIDFKSKQQTVES